MLDAQLQSEVIGCTQDKDKDKGCDSVVRFSLLLLSLIENQGKKFIVRYICSETPLSNSFLSIIIKLVLKATKNRAKSFWKHSKRAIRIFYHGIRSEDLIIWATTYQKVSSFCANKFKFSSKCQTHKHVSWSSLKENAKRSVLNVLYTSTHTADTLKAC